MLILFKMGPLPSEDDMARMLEDPNNAQQMNEALNNPAFIDMMIQNSPQLRGIPGAREMLQSPQFRQMLTNPDVLRQSAQMRRMMQGGGGAGGFPAPGVTDTTPSGTAGSNPPSNPPAFNPFAALGPGAGNPFAALLGGQTPVQTPPPAPGSAGQGTPAGQGSPGTGADAAANPFASLFGGNAAAGGANPFGMTPEMMQMAMQQMMQGGGGGFGNLFGGAGGAGSPPPPADTRPPEEIYADQLRQLNDMGFHDFDRNVAALRRAGGSVQGAIEQLLS